MYYFTYFFAMRWFECILLNVLIRCLIWICLNIWMLTLIDWLWPVIFLHVSWCIWIAVIPYDSLIQTLTFRLTFLFGNIIRWNYLIVFIILLHSFFIYRLQQRKLHSFLFCGCIQNILLMIQSILVIFLVNLLKRSLEILFRY